MWLGRRSARLLLWGPGRGDGWGAFTPCPRTGGKARPSGVVFGDFSNPHTAHQKGISMIKTPQTHHPSRWIEA